uniref:Uncharacterized protein n=1 Tax=viral metagenome TaxID=1070528 RepID=A0A6C0DHY7_9ZZZZ
MPLSLEDRFVVTLLVWWNAIVDIFRTLHQVPSLDEDGYCVLESGLDAVPRTTLSVLPPHYMILPKVHTNRGGSNPFYWRSSTFFKRTVHPTYLAVHYEHPGPALSVSKGSHLGWQMSLPTQLNVQQNSLVLMNSGLLKAHIDTAPQTTVRFLAVHQHDNYLFDQQENTESVYIPSLTCTAPILEILSYLVAVPVQGIATLVWTVGQFVKEKLN